MIKFLSSRNRGRSLGIGLSAAALLTSLSVGSTFADTADPGVRCAAKVGPGQYEFYLPGEKATDVNGVRWVCGPDGQWFRDYSSSIVVTNPTVRPLGTYVTSITTSSTMIAAR